MIKTNAIKKGEDETIFTALDVDKAQRTTLRFYCQWEHGAKEYFMTMAEAVKKAEAMYKKTPHMTDENFAYWLTQKTILGTEITIDTPIYKATAKG